MSEMIQLVSTGKTQIQSVSIVPSTRRGCNAGCRSCIAHMTPGTTETKPSYCPLHRVRDLLDYGKQGGAMTAIFTSKSEPTLDYKDNRESFLEMMAMARDALPQVDMHTNGILLAENTDFLKDMYDYGLNMLTLSLANFKDPKNRAFMRIGSKAYNPYKIIEQANRLGILMRCSVLLTKQTVSNLSDLLFYIRAAKEAGVDMIVVRELWNAPETLSDPVSQWCAENFVDSQPIYEAIRAAVKSSENGQKLYGMRFEEVRILPWGTQVFSIDGVNVTFANCDEKCPTGTIKSVQLVPKTYPGEVIGWRMRGSWGNDGDTLG